MSKADDLRRLREQKAKANDDASAVPKIGNASSATGNGSPPNPSQHSEKGARQETPGPDDAPLSGEAAKLPGTEPRRSPSRRGRPANRADTFAETKPWRKAGMSERTWYRRKLHLSEPHARDKK